MDTDGKGDSEEEFKRLQITSLDDDDDDVERKMEDEDEVDEDDEEEEEGDVILGFVEKPENSWSLLRQQFPSKAGGVPAWLDPDNLPSEKFFLCDICGKPLQFVIQCLSKDQHEQWKRHPERQSRSVKVFRCQLPRANPFYSSEAPKGNATDKPLTPGAPLCTWCGTWKGNILCSCCRIARYCSKEHQTMHSDSGHQLEYRQLSLLSLSSNPNAGNAGILQTRTQKVASKSLWPEFEIKNEHESEYDTEMSEDDRYTNNWLVSRNNIDDTLNSLQEYFEGDGDKRSYASFQRRIANAPEQVLRYCRRASSKPLWPMCSGRPSKDDIPRCNNCGGPLCFEFQILPQLLYYFGVKDDDEDSLDWAIIAVYTCESSCEGVGYKEEFAWVQVQPIRPTNLP